MYMHVCCESKLQRNPVLDLLSFTHFEQFSFKQFTCSSKSTSVFCILIHLFVLC